MYTAVIRRLAGGGGLKTAKRTGGDLFMLDTCSSNLQTFFRTWPRHQTTFLCYGRSVRAELSYPPAGGPLSLGAGARRGYGHLAVRAEQAELAEAGLSLQSTPASGAMAAALPIGESTAEPPPVSHQILHNQQQQQQQQQPPAATAPSRSPITLHSLRLKYARNQPISMVTAYDYPSARLADAAGVDMLLVGDSLGMVVLGREDTTDVTMDEMVHHCKAARKGAERALVIGDLPFGSCLTPVEAARNGVRLVKEGRGAHESRALGNTHHPSSSSNSR
jgi:3-methyl-2-oxobutanoate hydroxymethyltransferase